MKRAETDLNTALEKTKNPFIVYLNRAKFYQNTNRPEEAFADFQQAINLNPSKSRRIRRLSVQCRLHMSDPVERDQAMREILRKVAIKS
jgi:hypothetical protein